MAGEFARLGPGHGLCRGDRHGRGVRQRHGPGHGHGRQHQHRAAHPGHRPRGRRAILTGADQRARRKTPNICKVSPSSSYHIEDVARAGGIHTILGEIARGCPGLLRLSCPTVSGKTLGQNIEEFDVRSRTCSSAARVLTGVRPGGERTSQAWTVPSVAAARRPPDWPFSTPKARNRSPCRSAAVPRATGRKCRRIPRRDVIRPVDRAYSRTGGLTMLAGNLAPRERL